jgi:hypothetical protein
MMDCIPNTGGISGLFGHAVMWWSIGFMFGGFFGMGVVLIHATLAATEPEAK